MPAQQLQGIVTKAGVMAKTVTMTVEKHLVHPKLLKSFVRHKKYLVHDENSKLKVGDTILAQACQPLSARKRFTLFQNLGKISRGKSSSGLLGAEEQEKNRIERLVKREVAKQGGFGNVAKQAKQEQAAKSQSKAAMTAASSSAQGNK